MTGQLTLDQYEGFGIPKHIDRINVNNRLFIPLDERWHKFFLSGEKEWEMRGVNGTFNSKTVRKGRTVEIRRGYQYDPVWGIISDRLIVKSLDDIPKSIYDKIIPPSIQQDPDVLEFVQNYADKYNKLILFRIELQK